MHHPVRAVSESNSTSTSTDVSSIKLWLRSCGGNSADRRTIGYYESWSYKRPCNAWSPEDLNADALTHINYAFALIGSDNRIAAANSYDPDLYRRTTALKLKHPNLKVFISVGGWDAGTVGFVQMASSAANRATFISSARSFMASYGFDGIDIDWYVYSCEAIFSLVCDRLYLT